MRRAAHSPASRASEIRRTGNAVSTPDGILLIGISRHSFYYNDAASAILMLRALSIHIKVMQFRTPSHAGHLSFILTAHRYDAHGRKSAPLSLALIDNTITSIDCRRPF